MCMFNTAKYVAMVFSEIHSWFVLSFKCLNITRISKWEIKHDWVKNTYFCCAPDDGEETYN